MSRHLILALLLGMAVAVSGAGTSGFTKPKAKGRLAGKLRDRTYIAPKDIFRLASPVDGDWGGIVEDKPGYVGFSDDAGQLFRIEHIDYAPQFDALRAELGDRKFCERLIADFYLPKTILAVSPNAKFVAHAYTESPEAMLITCWFVPKGSNIMLYKNGVSERLDSYRAVVVLVRKARLYFISVAPSTGKIKQFGGDAEKQLWPKLEAAVHDFIRTIEFR